MGLAYSLPASNLRGWTIWTAWLSCCSTMEDDAEQRGRKSMRSIKSIGSILSCLLLAFTTRASEPLLLEAEAFDDTGGWVNDPQFMDQMGSPFLLAHGLGNPVEDAVTEIEFPETGTYHLWVRTRDWVGPWKTPDTPATKRAHGNPGRFQVLIDGKALPETFGSEGADWHWQKGGQINIRKKQTLVALHDLTGFEGRCDAILFSSDAKYIPPNNAPAPWRRKLKNIPKEPEPAGNYELVVVGGGMAGTCAAVSGARHGLKVAFIQDRPVLGGNNSSEVRVWLQGAKRGPYAKNIGNVLREFEQHKTAHYGEGNQAELYEDEKKLSVVRAEKNIAFYPSHRVNAADTKDGRIVAVIAENVETGRRLRFTGANFADCTGDGCVGYLAGADYEMTIEKGHMGRCNLWHTKDMGKPVEFPRCPWALDLTEKPFPGRDKSRGGSGSHHSALKSLGGWYWESGFYHDPFDKSEYIRDWNFRAMYGAWDCLKNIDKVYPTRNLAWAAYISGKRESRRLLGDLILNKEEVTKPIEYDDGFAPTGWKIDLHLPHPSYVKGFEGDAFISKAYFTGSRNPYYIPYRYLYSRNISNLFMAGRCSSVTHEALGTVRVMRTGALMGEVVGMAASLCTQHQVDPRGVYEKHLPELKQLCGVGGQSQAGDAAGAIQILPAGKGYRVAGSSDQYKVIELPAVLKALPSVVIPRGDWKRVAPGYRFAISAPAVVYIAVHNRGQYAPPKGWKKTDITLKWYNCTDSVYVKSFDPGIAEIPGHDGRDGANYGVPHTAFIEGVNVDVTSVEK